MSLRPLSPLRRGAGRPPPAAPLRPAPSLRESRRCGPASAARAPPPGSGARVVERRGQPVQQVRRRPSRPSSSGPKTERMITSWVIACMCGQSSNGSPAGQLLTRCGSPRSSSRRRRPSACRGTAAASGGGGSCARALPAASPSAGRAPAAAAGWRGRRRGCRPGAVKTRLTSSGSQRKTHVPEFRMRRVKVSPKRSWQRFMNG